MALEVTSCTMREQPSRLLDKGPEYFNARTNSGLFTPGNRRSAVELLEATKSQYVKSSQVLVTRQKLQPTDSSAVNQRKSLPVTSQPSTEQTDVETPLRNQNSFSSSIGLLTNIFSPMSFQQTNTETVMDENSIQLDNSTTGHQQRILKQSKDRTEETLERMNLNCTVVSNKTESDYPKLLISESACPFQNSRPSEHMNANDSVVFRRQKKIYRSQSDVTCHGSVGLSSIQTRLSRASVELEKFFNQMGIDRNILDPMIRQQEASSNNDAEFFENLSSVESPDSRSICSGISRSEKGKSDSDMLDRTLSQTSIIEKNARIIKWLCNVKRARSQSMK